MNFRLRTAALFAATMVSLLAQPAEPAAAAKAPPRIVSPEVAADRRVTFRLYAPKAREVLVAGEFMSGNKSLEKNSDGLWSVTVGPLEPEIYNYTFTIDGVRTIDPGNPDVKFGSTPSTIQSILEVRGNSPAFYTGQPVAHGDVRTLWYDSKSLHAQRRVTVYLPPGYDADSARSTRYPVLYLFHGANADETAWIRLGHANLILDNLLAAGKTKPFIVVMPFGYGAPPNAPAGGGQNNTALFSRDLLEDVIPLIESRHRTLPDREHRAIVGLSMGGGQSLSIGLSHPELFSVVGGFSAALNRGGDFGKAYPAVAANGDAKQRPRLLWIGCGTEDSLFPAAKAFSAYLTENHITHTFRESPGAHTWMVWRRYLQETAPLLFP